MSDPTVPQASAHLPSQPVAPLPTRYAASEGQGRGERAIVFEQGLCKRRAPRVVATLYGEPIYDRPIEDSAG